MTRQSDLAPIATLTTLGTQEVQVYTGGTPATSNSSGLAGYINQVDQDRNASRLRDGSLGVGGPSFYHSAVAEVSGATPDRLFSYYVGFAGCESRLSLRESVQRRGQSAVLLSAFDSDGNASYNILDGTGDLDGSRRARRRTTAAIFSPATSYAQATNFDRENVVNLHFGIPHHNTPLRDDVQLLSWPAASTRGSTARRTNSVRTTSVAADRLRYPVTVSRLRPTTPAPLMQAPEPQEPRRSTPFPNSQPHALELERPPRTSATVRTTATRSRSCSIRRTSTTTRTCASSPTASIRTGSSPRRPARSSRSARSWPTTKCSATSTAACSRIRISSRPRTCLTAQRHVHAARAADVQRDVQLDRSDRQQPRADRPRNDPL